MDRMELVDGLDLHDQAGIHEQIDTWMTQQPPAISQRDCLLALERNPAVGQFDSSGSSVDTLAHPWAKFAVNGQKSADRSSDKILQIWWQRRMDS